MYKKIRSKIIMKFRNVFAYWCPNCPKRFASEKKFHKHYMVCENRRRMIITKHEDAILKKYNRKQRRALGLTNGNKTR